MNILVTGAGGQLGRCIRRAAGKAGFADNYIFATSAELDITDAAAVRAAVSEHGVGVIINCAAYTDVDAAEDHPELAARINSDAVRHLADAMAEAGGTLVHISSDYVFGGNVCNTPLAEDAPAAPTGVYGLTKLQGERQIAESGARALVLRTSWLYSEYGKNFMKTMLRLMASRPQVNVVFDQCGTPTYAGDLAEAVVAIVGRRLYEGREGIYHYSDEGVCTWFDFARAIAETAGCGGCDIVPCRSCEFPSKVVRPSYSVLDKSKFKDAFGMSVPYWTDSLKTAIRNLNSNEA